MSRIDQVFSRVTAKLRDLFLTRHGIKTVIGVAITVALGTSVINGTEAALLRKLSDAFFGTTCTEMQELDGCKPEPGMKAQLDGISESVASQGAHVSASAFDDDRAALRRQITSLQDQLADAAPKSCPSVSSVRAERDDALNNLANVSTQLAALRAEVEKDHAEHPVRFTADQWTDYRLDVLSICPGLPDRLRSGPQADSGSN